MKGKYCPFLHRPPLPTDIFVPAEDCFGREKNAYYRDDMTGVGLFNRVNKTLYVTGLHVNDDIEETLSTQFGEFAPIDKIRVLKGKACAFISFKYELGAQFAKEAMDGQTLDGNDTLTVRWAREDPNPNAQQLARRSVDDDAFETVKRVLGDHSKKPVTKKRKREPVSEPDEVPVSDEDPEVGADLDHNIGNQRLLGSARLAALGKLQSGGKPQNGHTRTNGRNFQYDPKTQKQINLEPNLSSRPAGVSPRTEPSSNTPKKEPSSNTPKNESGSSVHATAALNSHFGGYDSSDED